MSRFMSQLRVSDTPDVPNASETMRLDRAARRLQAIVDAIAEFEQGPMAEFRTALQQSGLALLPSEGK